MRHTSLGPDWTSSPTKLKKKARLAATVIPLLSTLLVVTVLTSFVSLPARASFPWSFSLTTLSQAAYDGPALAYNPDLGKVFMGYPAGTGCCGDVNVIYSSDMTTWSNSVDAGSIRSGGGKMGFTFNGDDRAMYLSFGGACCTGGLIPIYVMSSTDGSAGSWSSPVLVSFSVGDNSLTGAAITFDSGSHRLLLAWSTFTSNGYVVYLNQSYGPIFNRVWSKVNTSPISYSGSPVYVANNPDLKFINGKLYMAYGSPDQSLHVIQSSDGVTWTNKVDFPGQSGVATAIDYNPVESSFHLDYAGVTNPYYIYDNQSPDGITWTGPTRLDGPPVLETRDYPALAFVSNKNVLSLSYTGTDGAGNLFCPCTVGHLNVAPQVHPANAAQYIPPGQTLQTGSATGSDTADSMVSSYNPDTNYGTSATIRAEYQTACHQCGTVNDHRHAFILFSLPSLPQGAQVTQAMLVLSGQAAWPSGSVNLQFWAASSSWSEGGLTWNNAPGGVSGSNLVFNGVVTSTNTFDLTAIANKWSTGQYSNYGIWVEETASGLDIYYGFDAKEYSTGSAPSLSITYTYYTPSPPSVPSTMCPGQTATASITMKNIGTTTWNPPSTDPSNPYRLGSQNPQDNTAWGFARVELTSAVAPGNQYTFQFTFTAPSTTGTYNFQWRMVQDGVEWFGDFTVNTQITVNSCAPPMALDGSAQASCSHYTTSCPVTLSTSHQNDIITAFTSETLDLATSCNFSVVDTAGLSWAARSPVVYGRYDPSYGWRDQLQEWWAKSSAILSSDTITESISGCGEPYYGGEYNGVQVLAITGANFNSPFDPNSGLPGTGSGTSSSSSATISTANPIDFVFAGVQAGGVTPAAQSGFTMVFPPAGAAVEYEIANGTISNSAITFSFGASAPWEEIADAVQQD